MLNICSKKAEKTGGLAAPQIGENKQITIIRRVDLEETASDTIDEDSLWKVIINPEIVLTSKEQATHWEGCLSIKKGELFGPVTRPYKVKINFLNRKGRKESLEAKGFFSHVLQHEIDHLHGILFLKYVEDPEKLWTGRELDNYIDKHNDLPTV